MAKRFTDTGKWDKQSFSDLSLKMKVVWIYLCDKCDHAGVWDINLKLLSFQVGESTTLEEIAAGLGDRIEVVSTSKLIVKGFLDFQYGDLNPENRVHKSVLLRLEKLAPSKPLNRTLKGAKDKDKDKDKEKAKEKEYRPHFEIFWKHYPRHTDKSDAFRAYLGNIEPDEHARAYEAVTHYRAELKAKSTEAKFVKLGATFLNKRRWTDWTAPPKSEDFSQTPTQSASPDSWESRASLVLDAIKKAGSGSGAFAEREAALGHELHALAVKAGIQRIRDVKADGFALRTIAGMLQRAAEATGGAA